MKIGPVETGIQIPNPKCGYQTSSPVRAALADMKEGESRLFDEINGVKEVDRIRAHARALKLKRGWSWATRTVKTNGQETSIRVWRVG